MRRCCAAPPTPAARIVYGFGQSPSARIRALDFATDANGTTVTARLDGGQRQALSWRLGAPGTHLAANSLAVAAVLDILELPLPAALAPLAAFQSAAGRGARQELVAAGGGILLIDESYNANPASVAAALVAMATVGRDRYPRRIAVLGDMLELGPEAARFHQDLQPAVEASGADLVFCCGGNMKLLFDSLPSSRRGAWGPRSSDIVAAVADALQKGDVVMIKGSLGTRMAPIVEAIKKRFAPPDRCS